MTSAQESFLRRLAEKLGWTEFTPYGLMPAPGPVAGDVLEWVVSGVARNSLDWLLKPDGMMYLFQRAREKRFAVNTYRPADGPIEVYCRNDAKGKIECAANESEPWATALAVGEMFGVKMEEGS